MLFQSASVDPAQAYKSAPRLFRDSPQVPGGELEHVVWVLRAVSQQRVQTVDRRVRTILEEAAVARQGECDAVVAGPFRHLADVAASCDQDRHEAVPQAVEGDAGDS